MTHLSDRSCFVFVISNMNNCYVCLLSFDGDLQHILLKSVVTACLIIIIIHSKYLHITSYTINAGCVFFLHRCHSSVYSMYSFMLIITSIYITNARTLQSVHLIIRHGSA